MRRVLDPEGWIAVLVLSSFACFVVGAFKMWGPIGWLVLGVLLFLFGWAMKEKHEEKKSTPAEHRGGNGKCPPGDTGKPCD